jgi:hypothetical protein
MSGMNVSAIVGWIAKKCGFGVLRIEFAGWPGSRFRGFDFRAESWP